MFANSILIIAFTNIIARASYIRFIGEIMEGCIKLTQITLLLCLSPLLPCKRPIESISNLAFWVRVNDPI